MRTRLPTFFVLCALCLACRDSPTGPRQNGNEYPATPSGARFVTTDIDHFWEAYDAGGSAGGTSAFQEHVYAYGLLHEHELWTEFKAVMSGTDATRWLYNQGTATGDRPGDLGYFIGYRIAQAFYAKAVDKSAALREIIELKNASAFLAASGYDG